MNELLHAQKATLEAILGMEVDCEQPFMLLDFSDAPLSLRAYADDDEPIRVLFNLRYNIFDALTDDSKDKAYIATVTAQFIAHYFK